MKETFEFDESTHTYYVNGCAVPSVTQLLAPITIGKYPKDVGVIQAAARRGTRIHELCNLYDLDALPEEFEGSLIPYVQAWSMFCRDYKPEWIFTEKPMHDGLYYAGTMDRLGIIDGMHTVVDIKTAQSLDRPAKVALAVQLYAYQRMAKQLLPAAMPVAGMGVQLLKTGRYRVYWRKDLEYVYKIDSGDIWDGLCMIYEATHGTVYDKEEET